MTMGPSSIIKRYLLSYGDLTAAGTTQTIDLDSLPKGTIVKGVRIKNTTVFATGNTTLTVSVGSAAGNATTFSNGTFDLFSVVADTIQAFFTASTSCATFGSGAFFIDVEYWYPEDLTATGPSGNSSSGGLL
jgi:hypothetical protein